MSRIRTRNSQINRQWIMLQMLATSRFGMTAKALAAELEVNPRTIHGDLNVLLELFPDTVSRVETGMFRELVYRAKNFLILSPRAPRPKHCGGCGDLIPNELWYCTELCRAEATRRADEKPVVTAKDPTYDPDDPPAKYEPTAQWETARNEWLKGGR
jgi:hypothetical protein